MRWPGCGRRGPGAGPSGSPGAGGPRAPAHGPGPAGADVPFTLNFEVVGHTDLGGDGFHADVWGHDGYAYVGIWGTPPGSGGCPASGYPDPDSDLILASDINSGLWVLRPEGMGDF
jgi:hypothetical protein